MEYTRHWIPEEGGQKKIKKDRLSLTLTATVPEMPEILFPPICLKPPVAQL
jgi:hypothetical protein